MLPLQDILDNQSRYTSWIFTLLLRWWRRLLWYKIEQRRSARGSSTFLFFLFFLFLSFLNYLKCRSYVINVIKLQYDGIAGIKLYNRGWNIWLFLEYYRWMPQLCSMGQNNFYLHGLLASHPTARMLFSTMQRLILWKITMNQQGFY